jgi:AcrR family transcriptional regulator
MTADRWIVGERAAPAAVDGTPLSARGVATRQRILEAAEDVFAAHGWQEASIVKITERAGVAQGSFYRYFVSKQAVFDELVSDLNRRVRRAMSEGAAMGSTAAEAERFGFEAFFRYTAEHPALYRVIRQAEFASPEAFRHHYERIAQGYIATLTSAMEAGEMIQADPELLAYALMGIGEMVGLKWILWEGNDGVPSDKVDDMMTFILRGLGLRS